MVLTGHVRVWIAVPPAIRHDDEDGVVSIFLVRFDGLDDLFQAFVHDRDGAGVMVQVAPMDVVAVLVIDHQEPGPQFPDGADGQFGEQPVATRIDHARIPVIVPPSLPEDFQFGSRAIVALSAVIHLLPLGQVLLPLLDFLPAQSAFGDLVAHQPRFEAVKAEHVRAVVDAISEVIAERVEFLIRAILAIDDERLMRRNIERLAKILEDGRHFRLETRAQKLALDIFVLVV